MTLKEVGRKALVVLGFLREDAVDTIYRAKAEIQHVTATNTAKIETAVSSELFAIRSVIAHGFERIADLADTGAVAGNAKDVLAQAQTDIGAILARVDAAI